MITTWRVVRPDLAARALDGEGARRWGGRWNSPGRAAVYTAATTSLSLLEKMVHAESGLLPAYFAVPVSFEEVLVETLELVVLPADWRSVPAPRKLQVLGDAWVESMRSCILEVPSVVVPHESNFVLNSKHPDFASIEIGEPVAIEMDSRLG
jgi:RES domain-containing protein